MLEIFCNDYFDWIKIFNGKFQYMIVQEIYYMVMLVELCNKCKILINLNGNVWSNGNI